tara:strand:- start:1109 stop:1213 length:105 start_codon:yes stop_codon:yes gene_type:complete
VKIVGKKETSKSVRNSSFEISTRRVPMAVASDQA